jgi:penicillin-binding protein 1B
VVFRRKNPNQMPHPPRRLYRRETLIRALHFLRRQKNVLIVVVCALLLISGGVFLHYYIRFSRLVDKRLSGQIFHRSSLVLTAPRPIAPGEDISAQRVEDWLRRAFYSAGTTRQNGVGTFQLAGNRLLIYPGQESFFASGQDREGPAAVTFNGGQITSIDELNDGTPLNEYLLEPAVITTLFDRTRSKRLIITYQDCPKVLVHAVLAAEDRTFFSNPGVNVLRLVEAALADIRADRRLQGGSTLTMQLARNFFLTPRRTFRRKFEEIFLAMLIEHRVSKQDIFGMYANEIYMGQRGSFAIYGFGEAADSYFNKDVKDLNLPEAALLAGMIRGPNLYSPYRYPARARARRNQVIHLMLQNHFITPVQAAQASVAPLGVIQKNVGASQAPYFVDMVKDELLAHLSEEDLASQSYRIYTTLDPELQAAAVDGVRTGAEELDHQVRLSLRKGAPPPKPHEPQVALVVLDPHTGEIRALVGGRNYAVSQLNHALAMRQPGSSFKPFVYAAALSSAVDGSRPLITPATILPDQPMAFQFGNVIYTPHDYKDEYYGQVTVREALALSLNVATVNLAQMIGYDNIRKLALQVGFGNGIEATPAIALGAYDATPLQVAGAYTTFANGGVYEAPRAILAVKDASGHIVWQDPVVSRTVLDPRVDYLMVNLMETVIDHGTGAGVRARGFTAPAAGKTGTSHDGWFAGFTSNLLAVAWVGYDNDQDLNLTGASSALPIWTDFMKDASVLPAYKNMQPFVQPLGVISAPIGEQAALATANNPLPASEDVFIDGTQPVSTTAASTVASWIRKILPFGKNNPSSTAQRSSSPAPGSSSVTATAPAQIATMNNNGAASPQAPKQRPAPEKKSEGVLKRFFSIFKHHKSKSQSESSDQ